MPHGVLESSPTIDALAGASSGIVTDIIFYGMNLTLPLRLFCMYAPLLCVGLDSYKVQLQVKFHISRFRQMYHRHLKLFLLSWLDQAMAMNSYLATNSVLPANT